MNFGQHIGLQAEERLRRRAALTGIIECDGVPKVVQQITFSYALHGFFVLLFTGYVVFIPADYIKLDLLQMAEYHHYLQTEKHVRWLNDEGVFKED